MFLMFRVIEKPMDEPKPEICTFAGLRYNEEGHVAILSTEHTEHDYLMPIQDKKTYADICQRMYHYVSKCMMKPGLQVQIEGSPLYRVKKGSNTRIPNAEDYRYTIKAIHGESSFEIGIFSRKG